MTEPTDADLRALLPMKLLERDKPPKVQVWLTQKDAFAFARAVLAKWGTPPAVAGEPFGWACWIDDDDNPRSAHFSATEPLAYANRKPLYTTPQPNQAQAGAVPMTDDPDCGGESCDCRSYCKKKGGQHGADT
ncbi:hypothetical protein [Acidovorax kalamii]|uniref:hypothetical protein n=1 Tax=Acidovorax kalamii TaxID=2004485 RepID=UPI0020904DD3|nr:hypothetical protein [Acidovorax kalamii]MCO5355122.1 hypothetical protein [Acidovorax kalamii]